MKADLEKVNEVQYHLDRIREYIDDYFQDESFYESKQAKRVDRMYRECDYLDRFLSDDDFLEKVCEDFLVKIKRAKERVKEISGNN